MDLEEIKKRAGEFDEVFRDLEDDYEDFDEELADAPNMDRPTYLAFLAKRAATPYGRAMASFHEFIVRGVLDVYARADADDRQRILDVLASHPFALTRLFSLLREYRLRLEKSPAEEIEPLLRTLLVMAVLMEEYLEQVDVGIILSSAWRIAEIEGLDPRRYFDDAAELAGRRAILHGRSALEYLRTFQPMTFGGGPPGK